MTGIRSLTRHADAAAPEPAGPEPARHWAGGRAPVVVALVLLVVLAVGSLFIGVSDVSPIHVLTGAAEQRRIFFVSRVPRLAAIVLSGMAMSVAGLIMQHLARNRFVAPSTAGTVQSASLGMLVATVWFGQSSVLAKMLIATAFALAGTVLFLQILRHITFADVMLVPLVGLLFGGVISSITTFFAYRYDLLQSVDAWTNGDFSGVLQGRYELLYVAAGVTVLGYLYADRFTVAGMGRTFAVNLGLRYERVLNIGLATVALITAVVVVTVGSVPFLGLIVPNIVTTILGDNLRRVLPVTALFGAGFVLVCDIVSRTIRYPYEIPVGTVGGVVGAVIFLTLILRERRVAA